MSPVASSRLPAFAPGKVAAWLWRYRATSLPPFRLLVAAGFAATVIMTWPLWTVHETPPVLPLLPLPQFSVGVLLLAALALALAFPVPGAALLTALVAYAVAIDQTRLQPEVVSLLFLLWGMTRGIGALTLARVHLVSMWMYSGINKLLSPGFLHGTAQWILSGLVPHAPTVMRDNIGYAIALAEFSIGLLALFPRTRVASAVLALAVHVGIFVDLSPIGHDWNRAVWPWNIVLAFAGFALIAPWKGTLWSSLTPCTWPVRGAAAFLIVMPLGFYIGLTDPYLAHNLYATNTPSASYCHGQNCVPDDQLTQTFVALEVPLPADIRLFTASFQRTCQTGDHLMIHDPRRWSQLRGRGDLTVSCSQTR